MIEKILKFSIHYRYLVVLIVIATSIYSLYSLNKLPIDAVPDITNNQVQINITVPALSPEEMEKNVTFPIENALAGIPGLEGTRSISRNGFAQVTAIFNDHIDIYFARQQINERLNDVRENLPNEADPRMGPISTGLGEIYMWTVEFAPFDPHLVKDGQPGWQTDRSFLTVDKEFLRSDVEQLSYLRTIQDWVIRPQLKGIPGLAEIDSIGGYVKQYHVEPDLDQMLALGVGFEDITEALKNNNLSLGAGFIEKNRQALLVKADGRFHTLQDLGQVAVKKKGNTPILIRDIAEIKVGKELRSGAATENGNEVVIGTAMMLIGSNSRTVSAAIDKRMEEVKDNLPIGINVKILLNRTKLVDATIDTVSKNLFEGALLVILVLFFLMGNLSAAFITAMVIPLSMLMTGMGMIQSKISGNLMSLGALDFGLIVDGAVIIIENYLRRLSLKQDELGRRLAVQERLNLTMQSSLEMIKPSVYGQAIIMVVYLPLLTFHGVEGKMFHPMAATVLLALFSAFILSVTFVPAASALFITHAKHSENSSYFTLLKKTYESLLKKLFPHSGLAVCTGIFLFLISFVIATKMGQEFIPTLDEQDIALQAMRIPSTSISQAVEMQREVEETIKLFPQVDMIFSKTGTAEMASDPMPPNVSDTFVMLKPRSSWPNPKMTKNELIEELEQGLKKLVGNNYEFTQPIEMRFNELIAGVKSDVAVKVYGDDFKMMKDTAEQISHVLGTIPGAADTKVSQTEGLPLLDAKIDRKALERYQLNVKDLLSVISIALGGEKTGQLREGDRRFDIVVRLPEKYRDNPLIWNLLPIQLGDKHLPLSNFCQFIETEGVCEINRENGKRLVIAEVNVRGSDLGTFVTKAKKAIKHKVKIPPGYWIEWGGQFQNLLSAKEHLMVVIPLCLAMILLLLYGAFQSVKEALLVFAGIPMAITGGIITLWLRDMPLSISAAVGFIALSGIAVLNGLVMLSSINQNLTLGFSSEMAILEGSKNRLRPILMTALVASLGFIPMAFSTGTGAEVQKPLATVVIGGLISSTFLTLFLLPALCTLFGIGKEEYYEIQQQKL